MVTKKRSKIGWKMAAEEDGGYSKVLVKLRIDGKVVKPICSDGKVRTNKAKVLEIVPIYFSNGWRSRRWVGTRKIDLAYSCNFHGGFTSKAFKYKVGRIVTAKLDESAQESCGSGINFFFDRRKAINYLF